MLESKFHLAPGASYIRPLFRNKNLFTEFPCTFFIPTMNVLFFRIINIVQHLITSTDYLMHGKILYLTHILQTSLSFIDYERQNLPFNSRKQYSLNLPYPLLHHFTLPRTSQKVHWIFFLPDTHTHIHTHTRCARAKNEGSARIAPAAAPLSDTSAHTQSVSLSLSKTSRAEAHLPPRATTPARASEPAT